ncbi:MAG: hypothetical protein OCU12_07075 [Methanophagales archaeon]|nr:hypothetical protein [Methanophagales archaeon]
MITTFEQRIRRYMCPRCGTLVSRRTVERAEPDAMFVCDCGWEGIARELYTDIYTVTGRDALRVAEPAGRGVH